MIRVGIAALAHPVTPSEPVTAIRRKALQTQDGIPLSEVEERRLRDAVGRTSIDDDDWLAETYTRSMVRRLLATLDEARNSQPPVTPSEPDAGLRERLLVELAASIPGTCDWGDCDNNAMLARFDPEKGWLPVCQWHIDAGAGELAPITAVAFDALWRTAPSEPDAGLDVERSGRDAWTRHITEHTHNWKEG